MAERDPSHLIAVEEIKLDELADASRKVKRKKLFAGFAAGVALIGGGYDGWFELEVLSDDGTFGNDFPDSLWKRDPVELIRAGREQFMQLWDKCSAAASAAPPR